jgi:hypothetical protein
MVLSLLCTEHAKRVTMWLKNQTVYVYIVLTQTRTVTYYMIDCPFDKQNRNYVDYSQNLVMNTGEAQR